MDDVSAPRHFLTPAQDGLGRKLILTAGASFLGKLLGFIRLQQIAVSLGTTYFADVLLLGFQLIWLIEVVLISSAVVPVLIAQVYQVEKAKDADAAARVYLYALCFGLIASGIWGLVLFFFGESILVPLLAPGFDAQARELFGVLMLFGFMVPICLTFAQFLSLLNRLSGNGVWYSVPQIVTNLFALIGLLAGLFVNDLEGAVLGMIAGLLVGVIGVMALQVYVAPKYALTHIYSAFRQGGIKAVGSSGSRVFWAGVLSLIGASLVQELYVYIDFYFASLSGVGAVSTIAYASRLAALVNMLMVASALVILEPRWARVFADTPATALTRVVIPDCLSVISLVLGPAVLLLVFASDITAVVYAADQLEQSQRLRLNQVVSANALLVLGLTLALLSTRILVMAGGASKVVIVVVCVLPLKLIASYLLFMGYGLVGIAFSTSCALLLQTFGNLFFLSRRVDNTELRLPMLLKLVVSFVCVLLVAYALSAILPEGLLGLALATAVVLGSNFVIGLGLRYSYATAVYQYLGRS